MPEMSLVVVPEFPQSSVPDGAVSRACLSADDDDTVFIFNLDPHAAETADGRKAVSASKKLWISVVPFAMEPNMTLRWEMDLSPGTVISPGYELLYGVS